VRISHAGIALIKSFEGCKLEAYDDGVGVMTIGYGHTSGVKRGDKITQEEAERVLAEDDLPRYEKAVEQAITIPIGSANLLTQNQFDAMVSLCFNIGQGNFRASTLVRKFCAGDVQGAADQFRRWNRAGGKESRGLTRRREAERALFLGQAGTAAPAVQST